MKQLSLLSPQRLRGVVLPLRRRILALAWLKWLAFPGGLLLAAFLFTVSGSLLVFILVCVSLHVSIHAWEASLRRQFVRDAEFPRYLGAKLRAQYPQLSASDTDLVLHGLRQFFMAHLRNKRQFVAMPSAVVDAAWHEFILHTRAYEDWCRMAFGKLMHHTPAEVLGRDPARNNGLRSTWYWACKEESINPRQPSRLPLLFALDKKFSIAGGFSYIPDCSDVDRQSRSDTHCGTSFVDGDGGFGGSDAGDGEGSDGGCGGGCGGD